MGKETVKLGIIFTCLIVFIPMYEAVSFGGRPKPFFQTLGKEIGKRAERAAETIWKRKFKKTRRHAVLHAALYLDNSFAFSFEIGVGSPDQKMNVTMATGSELFWLQCFPCTNCTSSHSVFHTSLSKTFSKLPCSSPMCNSLSDDFTTSNCSTTPTCTYNTSLSTGDYSSDAVTVNGSKIPNVTFGCGRNISALLPLLQTSGIIGFNKGNRSFISQVSPKFPARFAYCVPIDSFYNTSIPGRMAVGHYHIEQPFNYTLLIDNPDAPELYYIGLSSIAINGKKIPINSSFAANGTGGTLIDSTMEFSFFSQDSYNQIVGAVESSLPASLKQSKLKLDNDSYEVQAGLSLCYNVPVSIDYPSTPSVVFNFEGTSITLSNNRTWVTTAVDEVNATICLAIGSSESVGLPFNVFGTYQQAGVAVEYDLVHSKIGFISQGCDSSKNLVSAGLKFTTNSAMLIFFIVFTMV